MRRVPLKTVDQPVHSTVDGKLGAPIASGKRVPPEGRAPGTLNYADTLLDLIGVSMEGHKDGETMRLAHRVLHKIETAVDAEAGYVDLEDAEFQVVKSRLGQIPARMAIITDALMGFWDEVELAPEPPPAESSAAS